MRNRLAALAVLALFAVSTFAATLPKGWHLAGNRPADYFAVAEAGAGVLGSKTQDAPGFGTMMQTFRADEYRGKRLRLTADVRSENVAGWAGVWMRVDAVGNRTLSFDNMQSRPIKGTSAWAPYSVVLDVPRDSESISFGILLAGTGKVWIDNVSFEEVDRSVPVTGSHSGSGPERPKQPQNLDFDR
ncbi:MAG TPA: hypothetical protein VHL59_04060 [Thermoanaerobaculia bacterium]|nr:hypothetical protein [Thermoanaerobaculia bacterium]